ncbi:MAG: Holliday junction resolvase RuvX [Gammaproteobacteria bacterium]
MSRTRTLLGFDYGSKRIGIAVGQALTGTATPLTTVAVRNGKPDWPRIDEIMREWEPAALVVGDPLNMDDTPQTLTEQATAFAGKLADRYHLPVHRADERLSSWEAKGRLKDTYNLDPVAAQTILETWLSEQGAHAANSATIPAGSDEAES